jgi:hypothetical protein
MGEEFLIGDGYSSKSGTSRLLVFESNFQLNIIISINLSE